MKFRFYYLQKHKIANTAQQGIPKQRAVKIAEFEIKIDNFQKRICNAEKS